MKATIQHRRRHRQEPEIQHLILSYLPEQNDGILHILHSVLQQQSTDILICKPNRDWFPWVIKYYPGDSCKGFYDKILEWFQREQPELVHSWSNLVVHNLAPSHTLVLMTCSGTEQQLHLGRNPFVKRDFPSLGLSFYGPAILFRVRDVPVNIRTVGCCVSADIGFPDEERRNTLLPLFRSF